MRDTATANGKLGAAVRAEYLRGKAAGLYDRIEHSAANEFARMSDAELRQVIVDQAKALEALGIDLLPAPKANPKKHWAIAWAHGPSAVEARRSPSADRPDAADPSANSKDSRVASNRQLSQVEEMG